MGVEYTCQCSEHWLVKVVAIEDTSKKKVEENKEGGAKAHAPFAKVKVTRFRGHEVQVVQRKATPRYKKPTQLARSGPTQPSGTRLEESILWPRQM